MKSRMENLFQDLQLQPNKLTTNIFLTPRSTNQRNKIITKKPSNNWPKKTLNWRKLSIRFLSSRRNNSNFIKMNMKSKSTIYLTFSIKEMMKLDSDSNNSLKWIKSSWIKVSSFNTCVSCSLGRISSLKNWRIF